MSQCTLFRHFAGVKRCRRNFLLAVLVSSVVAAAGAATAETLQDALVEVYSSNPQILEERAKLRTVDEGVPQALSGWRPTITLTGDRGRDFIKDTPALGLPGTYGTTTTLDANITQPLFRGGQTIAKTAAAEDNVSGERARNIDTEASVFGNVIQYYFDVLRDTAILALDIQYEQALRELLEVNTGRQSLGELSRADVAQTEGRYNMAVSQRHSDEGQLQTSRSNYEHYVGHPPGTLTEPTLVPVVPAEREDALKLAATNNTKVIAAIFDERAAQDTVDATWGQLLPSVDLVLDASRQTATVQTTNGQTITDESAVARLTIPLYNSASGDVYSLTRKAIDTVGQMKNATDEARRAAVQGVTQNWETLQAARAQVPALEAAVRANQTAVDGLIQEQLVGTASVYDVLNGEQDLYNSQVSLARAQHDLRVAEFGIAYQIGRLTVIDLDLPIKPYDAREHYDVVRDKWLGFGGASDH